MTKIILKKLKEYDTMWHPDSTLVFKSSTEKLVIGRYVDNELISLDEKALELCERFKFKYDSSLIEEEVETDGDEEKEGEEEGDEEGETETNDLKETEEVENVKEDGDKKDEDGSEEEQESQSEEPVNSIEIKEVISSSNEQFDFSSNFKFLDKYLADFKSSIDLNNENQARSISNLQHKLDDCNRDCEKYQQEIENHKAQYSKITDEYNKMNSEHSAIKEEYNKLKMKFEGIKNLFAL